MTLKVRNITSQKCTKKLQALWDRTVCLNVGLLLGILKWVSLYRVFVFVFDGMCYMYVRFNPVMRVLTKLNISIFNLEKVHFVGLYCIIILQCTVQKTFKKWVTKIYLLHGSEI
jgi:hypothetical protein